MVKEVSRIHAGFEDCEFLVRSADETELIEFVQRHAEGTHDVPVSKEHVEKIVTEV